MDNKEQPLTEQRVKALIAMEMRRYQDAMSKALAEAIFLNNRKIEQDLRDAGVIK